MEIRERLWMSGPVLLCTLAAWCAPPTRLIPIGSSGWEIEPLPGFAEVRSKWAELELEGRLEGPGPKARIEFHEGWRSDPLMCPDKNGDPVAPLGRVEKTLQEGRAVYTLTCADPITPGAFESKKIVLRGRKLGDPRGYLSASLSFIDDRREPARFLPQGQVDPALQKYGKQAFERAVASLISNEDELAAAKKQLDELTRDQISRGPSALPLLTPPQALAK
jgi:hypothetical protein